MNGFNELSLELFTRVQDDFEKRQYLVQAGLQKVLREFDQNRIYPGLGELADLHKILADISRRLKDLQKQFPKRISKIDLASRTIEHEVILVDGTNLAGVEELISWSMPRIEEVIRRGAAIYEFVEDSLQVEHVGIVPNYRESGYFFMPDHSSRAMHLYRFDVSIFQSADDQFRGLRTRLIESMELSSAAWSPNTIKLDLIKREKELPNPATYAIHTDLDFPFEYTMLPVARRKLMAIIT